MTSRLALERDLVLRTLDRPGRTVLRSASPDGRLYEVAYDVRTVVLGPDGLVREERRVVPVLFGLAPEHPLVQPFVVAGDAEIFHPNVASPRLTSHPAPIVCMGVYGPQDRIASWMIATFYLLAWARTTPEHPLNPQAADWARSEMAKGRFPTDRRDFFDQPAGAPRAALRLRVSEARS